METVTVPDPSFGAGKYVKCGERRCGERRKETPPQRRCPPPSFSPAFSPAPRRYGKRLQMQPVAPPPPTASYDPGSYTPSSPTKSDFGDDWDESQRYVPPPAPPMFENATQSELRLLTAARTREYQAKLMQKKVSRLENFVGDLKKSLTDIKNPAAALATSSAVSLGDKSLLGTAAGELAAQLNGWKEQQEVMAGHIERLEKEKGAAEIRAKRFERLLLEENRKATSTTKAERERALKEREEREKAALKGEAIIDCIPFDPASKVEHWTDIEGNFEYVRRRRPEASGNGSPTQALYN